MHLHMLVLLPRMSFLPPSWQSLTHSSRPRSITISSGKAFLTWPTFFSFRQRSSVSSLIKCNMHIVSIFISTVLTLTYMDCFTTLCLQCYFKSLTGRNTVLLDCKNSWASSSVPEIESIFKNCRLNEEE